VVETKNGLIDRTNPGLSRRLILNELAKDTVTVACGECSYREAGIKTPEEAEDFRKDIARKRIKLAQKQLETAQLLGQLDVLQAQLDAQKNAEVTTYVHTPANYFSRRISKTSPKIVNFHYLSFHLRL